MPTNDYDFWIAIGTVGAVIVALIVALVQAAIAIALTLKRRSRARQKVASLVSAWVEHTYLPSAGGDYYRRTVLLHIANESDEPVFKVEALCGIATESGTIQLGPLSVPRIVPVLPPKREFVYDVAMGMLGFGEFAHDAFREFVAEVGFRDHENKRWQRGFDGVLRVVKKPRAAVVTEAGDDLAVAQAGQLDSPYNPLRVVFSFANDAHDSEIDDEQFRQVLLNEADGWGSSSAEDISGVREIFRTANVASHVWYPTPRIAYVRMLKDLPNTSVSQPAQVLTLVWRNKRGWTLFGKGQFLPWMIPFAPGELEIDPLDGRERTNS